MPDVRYFQLHGHCIAIGRSMLLWAHAIRVHFLRESPARRWNMMRLFLGAMHTHYANVRREPDGKGGHAIGVSADEWRAMRRANLFTRAEVEQLTAFRGNKAVLAASWALAEVQGLEIKQQPCGTSSGAAHPATLWHVLRRCSPVPTLAWQVKAAIARERGAPGALGGASIEGSLATVSIAPPNRRAPAPRTATARTRRSHGRRFGPWWRRCRC